MHFVGPSGGKSSASFSVIVCKGHTFIHVLMGALSCKKKGGRVGGAGGGGGGEALTNFKQLLSNNSKSSGIWSVKSKGKQNKKNKKK